MLKFQERKSKIEALQKNINIINTESKVRKPHPSITTLFNGKHPKNRKNLKKLDVKIPQVNNKNVQKKILPRPPSIQSLITNSKNEEFLSIEKPLKYNGYRIIPLTLFSSSSSSTLSSVNHFQSNKNTVKINNNTSINQNNGIDYRFLNSNGSLPILEKPKISNLSQNAKSEIEVKVEKNLNELYQEFIQNVSEIIYLII